MEISKSKQLLNKYKTQKNKRLSGSTRKPRNANRTESRPLTAPRNSYSENNVTKFCSNSKPMPSLAELEKMYDGSDDDELPVIPSKARSKKTIGQSSAPITEITERCKTPEKPILIDMDKLCSPTTVKDISNKMLDFIENMPNVSNIVVDGPPTPVIPPKKRKKTETPYIVGCKDRRQLSNWVSSAVIGAGDPKYGIEQNIDDEDDEIPSKRQRKSNIPTPQYSLFNAQAEDIAAKLKENEVLSDASDDSNKTVSYDFMRPFSPEPSTSRDNDTFLKNEKRFNDSLKKENMNDSQDSDVELIEVPRVTINIDDDPTNSNDSGVLFVKTDVKEVKPIPSTIACVDLLEDDPYSSITNIDLDNDSDCEVIDVDDVIAGHASVLKKYKRDNNIGAATVVEPISIVAVDTPKEQCDSNNIDSNNIPETPQRPNNQQTENVVEIELGNSNPNCPSKRLMDIISNFFTSLATLPNKEVTTKVHEIKDLPNSPVIDNIRQLTSSIASSYKSPNDAERSSTQTIMETDIPFVQEVIVIPSPQTPVVQTGPINKRGRPRKTNNATAALLNSSDVIEISSPQMVQARACNVDRVCRPRGKRNTVNSVASTSSQPLGSQQTTSSNVEIPQSKSSPQTPLRRFGECPICMENLCNKSLASTICGHIFCMECIKAAVKSAGKKCPTCRKKLTGVGYHPIFL